MVLFDKRLDMGRDRGSIEAHHEQLTLRDALLARPSLSFEMRTIVLHRGPVSD